MWKFFSNRVGKTRKKKQFKPGNKPGFSGINQVLIACKINFNSYLFVIEFRKRSVLFRAPCIFSDRFFHIVYSLSIPVSMFYIKLNITYVHKGTQELLLPNCKIFDAK